MLSRAAVADPLLNVYQKILTPAASASRPSGADEELRAAAKKWQAFRQTEARDADMNLTQRLRLKAAAFQALPAELRAEALIFPKNFPKGIVPFSHTPPGSFPLRVEEEEV
jgi:uncharacterized iron-regulated membrane protein